MQNRGSRNLSDLQQQLDDDEQWRQLTSRADRRGCLTLIIGALIVGMALYFGGFLQ